MQKREAIGTLAGGIAHDFNNVISAILSNASVAEAELAAGESPITSLHEITRGARRAAEVVQRLLSFGREDEPRREPFDLALVVDEACALLRPSMSRGVTLVHSAQRPLPLAVGDSTQLHQVVVNLVANAGHAIAADPRAAGTVEVSVDAVRLSGEVSAEDGQLPPGRYLRLRVQDDGPGIPDTTFDRLFDPFFTTKPVGEGTGLGLTATQTIVRSHGGTIEVQSSVGAGALFTVFLPVAAEPPASIGQPAASRDAMPRILFVDDETALTRLAERAMPASGCVAVAFHDPAAALEAFRAAPDTFDALVSDLSMPGIGGLELVKAIRTIRPDLPVVLSSGFITSEAAAQARASGVGRVVPKPCAMEDLASAALALLAERSEGRIG